MIWLNKIKRWIIAHKNWLVLMGLFIVTYLLGKKANRNYLEMANLAKDQYKKENEELERLQKAKELKEKKDKERADKIREALRKEKERKLKDLENKNANIDDVFQDIGIKKK